MCDCPLHFDADAACRCQCDHEVEQAIEYLTGMLWDFLGSLDPALVKPLAVALRDRTGTPEATDG